MSEHEHEKGCKHKKVRYCKHCDVAFCRKCGREWGATVWHYQYRDAVYPSVLPPREPAGVSITWPTPITTTTSNEHVDCESGASWAFLEGAK